MTDNTNIPVLTDLIEKGVEIELSELGLDQDPPTGKEAIDIVPDDNPALEQEIRRILLRLNNQISWAIFYYLL
jgi:hypothetical protein